jgi:hypothetical protein
VLLSAKLRAALKVPSIFGVNVIKIVQELLGATLPPQVLV